MAATATPVSAALTCNTVTGPGTAVTIAIKAAAGVTTGFPYAVAVTATNGVTVTPSSGSLISAAATLTFTASTAAGCVGSTTSASTISFTAATVADVTVTSPVTVTNTATALTVSPASVALSCVFDGTTYTPGSGSTISVTSAATGGTPFTVDTTVSAVAAWATFSSTTGGTATTSATTYTITPTALCGSFAAGTTHSTVLHLVNTPAPDKTVNISITVAAPTPLTATPVSATLTYVKGSGTPGTADVAITAGSSLYFSVDSTTLPPWLGVDTSGAATPRSIRFSSTSLSDNLAPGTYSATVGLNVFGYAPLQIPVTLTINNKAPKLSIQGGTTQPLSWTLGTAAPTATITAISSDSPIPYTITTGGALAPIVSTTQKKGLIYNFGSQIGVTFNPTVFASAAPGSVLNGTVTIAWGSPISQLVITFNLTVLSPGSTITSISPAAIPTAAAGQTFTVAITGTGFVASSDLSYKTKVGIVTSGTTLLADSNISTTIYNGSNMAITITVPTPSTADANLPFSTAGNGGSVTIGVCNPSGTSCSTAGVGSTAVLTIGTNPIIGGITSASAFTQVSAPTLPSIAPYDIISIFGTNFCGTVCSSTQVLFGTPDTTYYTYPLALSPDAAGPTQKNLSVSFLTHGTTTVLATAPLLFATNGQINALVPGSLTPGIVDVVVNFGYGATTNLKSSAASAVNIVATDPGLFTIGSNGRGDAAVIGSNYAIVNNGNPAGMRTGTGNSDIVSIYMTGLGVPDTGASNASVGTSQAWSADCVSVTSFATSIANPSAPTTIDGAIMQSSLLNTNRLPPCKSSTVSPPTVTFGGVAGTVLYAGFVPDSIAGLYQINVMLPDNTSASFTTNTGATSTTITTPVQLPIVVTASAVSSQTGVNLWVAPRLLVAPPTALTGAVGTVWVTSTVVATQGTAPYTYTVSAGTLPAGLVLDPAAGTITGTPIANTAGVYIVTISATDSAALTGSTTFTLTVAGGLYVINSAVGPYATPFGTLNASVAHSIASGGSFPYAYAITVPATLPVGMTISPTTGTIGITALTPGGIYHVTVRATDSLTVTGTLTFDVVVNLKVTSTLTAAITNGSAGAVNNAPVTTGNTSTVAYSVDATTAAISWLSINTSTGVITATTGSLAGTYPITITATDSGTPAGGTGNVTGTKLLTVVIN